MSDDDRNIVQLQGVSKHFGSVVALDELDIDIRAGEFVTFLGPSGCGKSTTLRILGGFEKPTSGKVILDGRDVTQLPPNKRNVNMVFQDYALFPHMTVAENINFGLELKGLTQGAISARRLEVMSFLELSDFGERYPEQLSGGQRQRVALARALAPDPALLLLDEPLGALDAKLRSQVQQELKAIQRRTNTTFFFVTHDQHEALTMSDRIVVMNKGKVEQDGTPEELYLQPASRFVAEFIGETNFLNGTYQGQHHDMAQISWCGQILCGNLGKAAPLHDAAVTCSLRLEKIHCAKEPAPHADNVVKGRVVERVFMGSRTAVEVRVGRAESANFAIVSAYLADAMSSVSVGDELWLSWSMDDMAVLND